MTAPVTRSVIVGPAEQHMARRFSGGLTTKLLKQMKAAGGARAWFEQQLDAGSVNDKPGQQADSWFAFLGRSPAQIFNRSSNGVEGAWEVMNDLSRWTVSRRILSNRQVHEVMVDFWANLLNVPTGHDEAQFWRVDYDKTIRKHALGTFEALLRESVTHPAMGLYLNNAVSTKDAPNENLGRELLELHSVGVGNYDEDDVKNSARLLTGYRVDVWWPKFNAFYDPDVHDTNPVSVMGFNHPNSQPDGRSVTSAYLKYLALHPATAERIARRLCVRFVNDSPSAGLVNAVREAYLAHNSAITPTLRALVDHPEFAASQGRLIRTPMEDYIAAVRALRIKPQQPTSQDSYVFGYYWEYSAFGNPPYEWPAPNGYPEAGAAWTSAGRILNGSNIHMNQAAGWWPSEDVKRYPWKNWRPELPATTAEVIDFISQKLFFAVPTDAIRRGIATDIEQPLSRRLRKRDLYDYRIHTILASLLDSPMHLRK